MSVNREKLLNDKTVRMIRFAVIIIMAVFMCALACRNYSIWDDELFTLKAIDGTYSDLWNTVTADLVHPPLYYILLKAFADLFHAGHMETVVIAKLFSVLWIVLLMVQGSRILAKRYGERTALVFVLLLSGNMTVGYSVEIRMYSMALACTGLAYLYANETVQTQKKENWMRLTFWTVLGIYANYFAAFALIFLWLALLVHCYKTKTVRMWFLNAGIAVILYLPWVITVLTHYGTITDYETGISLKRIIQFFAFPFSCHNDAVSAVLLLFTAVLIASILKVNRKPEFFWVFILNPVWIGLLCIAGSVLFDKFFIGRYLLPGWGAFWAGIAIGTVRLKRGWFIPILAVIDLVSLIFIYRAEQADRIAMDDLLAYAEHNQPVLAESGVYDILHYLRPDLAVSENNDPSAKGKRFVYYWSDLYTQLDDSDIVMSFPLSVNSICVFEQ